MPHLSKGIGVTQAIAQNTSQNLRSALSPHMNSDSDDSFTPLASDLSIPLMEMESQTERTFRNSSHYEQEFVAHTTGNSQKLSWLGGKLPHKRLCIQPALPEIEGRVTTTLARLSTASLLTINAIVLLIWAISFNSSLNSAFQNQQSSDKELPVQLSCDSRVWQNSTFCGYNGTNCAPSVGTEFLFQCPSQCASVKVLEPHVIGSEEIIYQNMVIGGGSLTGEGQPVYRGDSFICQAAIHSGIISHKNGGCGKLKHLGEKNRLLAARSNDISSIEFLPAFPVTFTVSATQNICVDPQWKLLLLSVATSILVSLFTSSSSLFTANMFIIVFFQIALASDRPFEPDKSSLISIALERFLPSAFVVYAVHKFCIHRALKGLQAPLERTLFWVGGCWIGALNNYTFDRLPISRLTPHDIQQQPGAVASLLFIITIIIAAAVGQVLSLRAEGRLVYFLNLYLPFGLALGLLALIPNLQLRLHHYIIALILLPGTSVQTRLSLLYQGLLFGLFINGVARWGYASILQTADALREDGQLGSATPEILPPIFKGQSVIQFTIDKLAAGFSGISVLVNDVERYRALQLSIPATFEWTNPVPDEPTFFRFAFIRPVPLGGIFYGDFAEPGTWYPNGTWET